MASRTDSATRAEADRARPLREAAFAGLRERHRAAAALPPEEKMVILLRLQREILPILAARRPLAPHERPWPIRP